MRIYLQDKKLESRVGLVFKIWKSYFYYNLSNSLDIFEIWKDFKQEAATIVLETKEVKDVKELLKEINRRLYKFCKNYGWRRVRGEGKYISDINIDTFHYENI